ncbi:TonB-dependent receptor [Pedobacter sp. BS3]|uniref:TonB-dependent receptor n=1 Tax=Pedobacter sp. BS3 TaxID=2567937 RepID=UPI0011EE0089|nr:TonB-dependent receptor [Pedobacter sp. BS3]TZF84918.1 TonB-dependent receptor [Pedobacter sp. BS3]
MKLIAVLMLAAIIQVSAAGYAQVVSLKKENASLKEVINDIQRQTGYSFIISSDLLRQANPVNINLKNSSLKEALDKCFIDQPLEYVINKKTIVISRRKAENKDKPDQTVSVTGKVTDEKGEPLAGVSIKVKGTPAGTVSDADGNYKITVPSENSVLVFTYIGFATQEKYVGNSSTINVKLIQEVSKLDEIVVVGYGVQKRSDVTGAISSVTAEQVNKMPTTSVSEMLRGAAPGVQVTMGSAAPGGSSSILIRGRRSLSAGNDPLYIVDGVPIASIDDINASEIASVEILKDASAQSIYGARAANGVILVTTKRGVAGKTKVNVNSYAGMQNLYRNFEFYDGEQWAAYRKEAFYNAYGYYDEGEVFKGIMQDVYHSKKYVDWEDVMLKTAWQNKNDVLIQSGNDKTKYALSLGQFYQDGMVPSSDFKRFTGRLNIDQTLSNKVSVGSNIAYTKSYRNIADGSFNSFITMPPLAEVYNSDGSLKEDVTEAGESHYNPLWNISNSENLNITDRLNVNLFADWKITKNLSYRLNTSLNNRKVQENSYLGINHTTGRNNGGRAIVAESTYNDYLVENILNYTKDFGKHHFDATAMASLNGIQWKRISNTGFGFPNDDLSYHAIGSATSQAVPTYEYSDRKLLSYLARARYNYDSRYLVTAAVRVDGSSVFGANNKYGYFPSIALAWRAKQEEFLKNVDFLSELKVRLSYGQVGNQAISPYTTLGLADKYLTEFGNVTEVGYLPNSELTNPNLKWETSTSANLGLDYGFFNGRISGSLELYDTQTTDLLVERSLPTTTGYSSQLVNLGHVQNKGIELALNAIAINRKDFKWNVGINFTANRNKIKKIDGSLDANGKPANDLNNNWFIGQSMNVYYDYQFDGIWQLTDDIANSAMPTATPGSIRVKDVNGDHVISAADRVVIQRDPKFITSFITSFDYRNFNLSVDIYYLTGGYLYNSYLSTFDTGGDLTGKRNGIRRNYWTINNPSNEAPAPNFVQQPAYITSLAYEKADYLKLRNVSLSYKMPEKIVKKLRVDNLKLFSTLSNVWTLTDVQGYGPEQNPGAYPEPRTLLFGLNFSF